MAAQSPIGVFDSGVGGLSVLRDIRRELPHEHLVYVADSAHAPYGDRPREFVEARAIAVVEFLITRSAKAVVVACNTATGIAVETLRARFFLPIVAIEPALKPAAARTRSGVIGVLATRGTLASEKFQRLIDEHGERVRVITRAGTGLVDQIERGELSSSATRSLVEQYVRPMVADGADTIVLGCTHYPFISAIVQEVAGPSVTIIDPAVAVARELRRRLEANSLLSDASDPGSDEFWTSGEPDAVGRVIGELWARRVDVLAVPARYA